MIVVNVYIETHLPLLVIVMESINSNVCVHCVGGIQ